MSRDAMTVLATLLGQGRVRDAKVISHQQDAARHYQLARLALDRYRSGDVHGRNQAIIHQELAAGHSEAARCIYSGGKGP